MFIAIECMKIGLLIFYFGVKESIGLYIVGHSMNGLNEKTWFTSKNSNYSSYLNLV